MPTESVVAEHLWKVLQNLL